MSNWSEQLQDIGFEKTEQADGAVSFCYQARHRRASFWTQITVKQVGRPSPDSWQVPIHAELQIGIWKIHNSVKNMDVIVHTNDKAMLNDIKQKCNESQLFCRKSATETLTCSGPSPTQHPVGPDRRHTTHNSQQAAIIN